MRIFSLLIYYTFLTWLPSPTFPLFGPFFEWMRLVFVKRIFKECGDNVNISRRAHFGDGRNIEIGYRSGIGSNCKVPNDIKIGDYVMMGPNVTIYGSKHNFDEIDTPMVNQGSTKLKTPVIEDDVWIGGQVIILPGVVIRKGSIVAAGAVVSKSFPEYSIIGGNPAQLIRSRKKT